MEWGGPCGLAMFQDSVLTSAFYFYTRKLKEPALAALYMPETLLYLESTMSYKPTGEGQKELGGPCLCVFPSWLAGVLASWGQRVELGTLRLSPEWRCLLEEGTGSEPPPPGVLFSSGSLLLFLGREAGRAGELAAGRAGDPLGGGQKRLNSQPASSQR